MTSEVNGVPPLFEQFTDYLPYAAETEMDPYLQAFAQGVLIALQNRSVKSEIERAVQLLSVSGHDAAYVFNHSRISHQKWELSKHNPQYPEAFLDPELWAERMTARLSDSNGSADYRLDLSRRIASNKPKRYAGVKLPGVVYGYGQEGTSVKIIDFGTSQGLGPKKLRLYPENNPFGHVLVKTSPDEVASRRQQSTVDALLASRFALGPSVMLDEIHVGDKDVQLWAKSSSFYPSELLVKSRVQEYDQLVQPDEDLAYKLSRKLFFMTGNVAQPDLQIGDGIIREQSFDISCALTTLYQLRPEEVPVAIQNMIRYTKPNGLVIVQDRVKVSSCNPMHLEFSGHTSAENFDYVTLVLDLNEPDAGFQEFARWNNGRCTELILGGLALRKLALAA